MTNTKPNKHWWYETNDKDTARFLLGQKGSNPLVFVGVNPSTASPSKLDATTTRAARFSLLHGFDGWAIINIYPQRATLPKNIHKRINKQLHLANMKSIESFLKNYPSTTLVGTWGNLRHHRPYFEPCLQDLFQLSANMEFDWKHFATLTKSGQPRHISRLGYRASFSNYHP